ncbi:hypothetical protein [Streptomyces sp. NPDC054834]
MWGRIREKIARPAVSGRGETGGDGEKRTHNLFDAAAAYVSARAEDDQDRIDEAASWVSPEALSFGVSELACRAVMALARERDESPRKVARDLLGLPVA